MEIIHAERLAKGSVRRTLGSLILQGATFVYPTDTCYALGADSLVPEAVHSIYYIKRRDLAKPLPVIARDIGTAGRFCVIDSRAQAVFERFPGISLVLPKRNIPDIVNPTRIMVRIPQNETLSRLLEHVPVPVISTSANLAGDPNPYSIRDVSRSLSTALSMIGFAIDGGALEPKKPSTILDCIEGKVYREGEHGAKEVLEVFNAAH